MYFLQAWPPNTKFFVAKFIARIYAFFRKFYNDWKTDFFAFWCMLQRICFCFFLMYVAKETFLFFQFVSKDLIWWCRDIWQGQGLLVALQVGFGQFPPWKWINCSVFISYEQPPTLLSLHGWSLVSFLRTAFYLQSKWFSSQCTSFHKKSSAPVWKLLRHKSYSHSVVPYQLLSPQLSPTSFSGTHSCPTQAFRKGTNLCEL